MRPGLERRKRSKIFDPPVFHLLSDTQEWRRSVGKWVNLIKAALENGNDRMLNITYKILGQDLYNQELPSEQQKIFDKAQKNRLKDLINKENPGQSALDAVKTVAIYPQIVKVTRLINLFNKVNNWKGSKTGDQFSYPTF